MSQLSIYSYNVNGIRSALSKGLLDWLKQVNPDVLLLQELKANPEDVGVPLFEALGYRVYINSAEKKGYSGVAILSKRPADEIEAGCGHPDYDREGRVLRARFGDLNIISLYLPSGSSGEERQDFKFQMMDYFMPWLLAQREKHPKLVIGGDYNICHRPIDIHNPKSNAKSSGFLPEERAWMEKLIVEHQFTDTFRHFNSDPGHYSWWSFRFNSRAKNLGWRIDYLLSTPALQGQLESAAIHPDIIHSDHCPVSVILNES